jgi:transposase
MKMAAVQQLEAGSSIAEVARAFEINPNLLHRWRKEHRHGPGKAFPGVGQRRWDETKVAQLEHKVGQQAVEIDSLKGCLQKLEKQRMLQALTGRSRSTATFKYIQSQNKKGREMTVVRMCDLVHVSRAELYRFEPETEEVGDDLDLRDEIQKIALELPYYGRPRITAELKRRGWQVNHKRVGRILREDNLLCLRRGKFVVMTTDSHHSLRVYSNLAKDMDLTGIDQLWRAAIT